MVSRIEVSYLMDDRINSRTSGIQSSGFNVSNVRLVEVYTINREFSHDELNKIGEQLVNPVMQKFTVNKHTTDQFDFAIEIGFLPGVTDNTATTARETIEDFLKIKFKEGESVHSSRLLLFNGSLSKDEMKKLGENLANPLIQKIRIKTKAEYDSSGGMGVLVPIVKLDELQEAEEVDLEVSDEELTKIGKAGILDKKTGQRRGPLALDLDYLRAIREYFRKKGRKPTDLEIESLAQTWSEHCKHTIFAAAMDDDLPEGLYKTYIRGATEAVRKNKGKKDFCLSVFVDNSGAIVFDKKYLVTHKVETHNSPSALDPFGGSITGIVGVNRDTIGFGLGAKPCMNYYGYCFADPRQETKLYRGKNRTNQALQPKQIMNGVVSGVNAGGNCSGIPTPQGWCYFDQRYQGKPLVFVGTIGVMPRESKDGKNLYEKQAKPGDMIVVIGGRVGLDGIHGATFSSEAMDAGSPATAVQIGDPITQKKLSDAVVKEARDLGLYNSITDNGAGGISCSVAEMAKECNGCHVRLDAVPLKYPGMAPWEIWISESQERMTLAVPRDKLDDFLDLMQRRGVEATVIGEFNDSGKCVVDYHGKRIMDIELDFLHDGLPEKHLKSTFTLPKHEEPKVDCPANLNKPLLDLMARPNICSTEFISTQYDHFVQGGHVLGPVQGKGRVQGISSLTKVVLDSKKGVGLSQGVYPSYSDIDTYHMAAAGIDTAIRGLVCIGVPLDRVALLDNFCWCSSTETERLGQLKRAAKACYDYAIEFGAPLISGKDSMFNDFKGFDENDNPVKISVPPTLLISSIGVMDDVSLAVSLDAKEHGDLVYVVGKTADELGASQYFAQLGAIGNKIPKVNAKRAKSIYKRLGRAIKAKLVASAYPINHGGLGAALAKTAIGGKLGMEIKLPESKMAPDHYLFSESQSRFVVTVAPKNKATFESIMKSSCELLGEVKGSHLVVRAANGHELVNVPVADLEKSYKGTFKDY